MIKYTYNFKTEVNMDEKTRLQRKLIPVNIVVMILSLVAAISILVAPLLVINVGDIAAEIANMQESGDSESQDDSTSGLNFINTIAYCLKDTKLSISTITLANLAFSDSEKTAQMVTDVVADELKKSQDQIVATVAVEMLPTLIESGELDVDIDVENINVDSVLEKFNGILNSADEAQSEQAISDLVDEIQRQAVSTTGEKIIPDEYKDEIKDVIKDYYQQAKEVVGDELTMESFICVTISNIMNASGGGSGDDGTEGNLVVAQPAQKHLYIAETDTVPNGSEDNTSPENSENQPKIYTNYSDLIGGLLESSGGEGQGGNPMDSLSETLNQSKPYMQYAAYAMFGFAGIWMILFVFALVHLFLKNKRFTMWYVKLFGFFPCLIFGCLPLIGGAVLSKIAADAAINLGAIIGAIYSLTWISGACYIALWLVSIFWAFPIKHKIRKAA